MEKDTRLGMHQDKTRLPQDGTKLKSENIRKKELPRSPDGRCSLY